MLEAAGGVGEVGRGVADEAVEVGVAGGEAAGVLAHPAAGGWVVPAGAVELQLGGVVAVFALPVEGLVDGLGVGRWDGVAVGVAVNLAGDVAERVVGDVLAERAGGVDDVADGALVVAQQPVTTSQIKCQSE